MLLSIHVIIILFCKVQSFRIPLKDQLLLKKQNGRHEAWSNVFIIYFNRISLVIIYYSQETKKKQKPQYIITFFKFIFFFYVFYWTVLSQFGGTFSLKELIQETMCTPTHGGRLCLAKWFLH